MNLKKALGMRGSIYRTVARHFLTLAILNTVLLSAGFYLIWRTANFRTEQILHWEVAEHLAQQIEPLLADADSPTPIIEQLLTLHEINPRLEAFVLNSEGKVVYGPHTLRDVTAVPLEPLKRFIDHKGLPEAPILGVHPGVYRHFWKSNIFSAAPITTDAFQGYAYVMIGGHTYWGGVQSIGDYTAAMATIVLFGITLATSLMLGSVLFRYLTRSLSDISKAVAEFGEGNYEKRITVRSEDELGRLSSTINTMADRIVGAISHVEQADTNRRELLSNLSHDMRHPVAVVRSAIERLQTETERWSLPADIKSELHRLVAIAISGCATLTKRLEDLFQLSNLNSPSFQLRREEFSPALLLEDIFMQYSTQAEAMQIHFSLQLPERLEYIKADNRLVERVVTNLLVNAFHYAGQGCSVELAASEDSQWLTIRISDTGPGIPTEDAEDIFSVFTKPGRVTKGTGLGLAIAKRVADLHGGSISLSETTPGAENPGATFTLKIPRT